MRQYRALERELGLAPRPISINEYGSPRDAGVPGWLTRFVAKLERSQVDTADLAFWHKPGRLADLLVPVGGGSGPATQAQPTGNYWLYKWYAEMSGSMVETTPPAATGRTIEVGDPVPAPATRVPGHDSTSGNALDLGGDAPNRYVTLPAGVLRGIGDFTISAWVDLQSPADWARLFDFGTGTQVNMFLAPRTGDAATGNAIRFAITNGSGEQHIDGTAPLPTGWSHVAVTKSGTVGTLYVNGTPVGVNPNLTLSPGDLAGGETTNNWIGKSQYADPLLDAVVDDFELFDRALSPAELTSGAVGDVVSYPFDETSGPTVLDGSGNHRDGTITTRIDGIEHLPAPDAFASADPYTRTTRVVFGGGAGDLQLKVGGLAGYGRSVGVRVVKTEWTGTDGVSAGPTPVFEGTYPVRDGQISVPVNDLDETTAYLAVITPGGQPHVSGRYEAESTGHGVTDALTSDNEYVRVGRGGLTFAVHAATAGAYDLDLRYTAAATTTARLTVDGRRQALELAPTSPFRTKRVLAVLHRGWNVVRLDGPSGPLGIDYLDVAPFQARFEAERGEPTDASVVNVNMDISNFFAPYVSGNAYVGGLSQPDSALSLPITVPAAGSYRLTIGYSTEGSQADRRAQVKSGQFLRLGAGPPLVVSYDPTQFRELIRQTEVVVQLPAGSSVLTFAKSDPSRPGVVQPGTVLLDSVTVDALR